MRQCVRRRQGFRVLNTLRQLEVGRQLSTTCNGRQDLCVSFLCTFLFSLLCVCKDTVSLYASNVAESLLRTFFRPLAMHLLSLHQQSPLLPSLFSPPFFFPLFILSLLLLLLLLFRCLLSGVAPRCELGQLGLAPLRHGNVELYIVVFIEPVYRWRGRPLCASSFGGWLGHGGCGERDVMEFDAGRVEANS